MQSYRNFSCAPQPPQPWLRLRLALFQCFLALRTLPLPVLAHLAQDLVHHLQGSHGDVMRVRNREVHMVVVLELLKRIKVGLVHRQVHIDILPFMELPRSETNPPRVHSNADHE